MKKKTHEILEKIRLIILSENFKMTYRSNEEDFILILHHHISNLDFAYFKFYAQKFASRIKNFGKFMYLPIISKQAFSAARKKLLPTAFVELNKALIREFYSDNEFKTFLGRKARLGQRDNPVIMIDQGIHVGSLPLLVFGGKNRRLIAPGGKGGFQPWSFYILGA